MVSDSPIDHSRHYGVFTGVGRHFHSHSRVGGTWACLVLAIGVLHVRGFPARITNSSFVSWRLCGCSIFRHQSGLGPLFSTMPTNHGSLRYPSVGHSLMHILDRCITGCFLWFYPPSFTFLSYAATCIHRSAVVNHEALFFSSRHTLSHMRLANALHGIWFFVSCHFNRGFNALLCFGFLTTVGCFSWFWASFSFVRKRISWDARVQREKSSKNYLEREISKNFCIATFAGRWRSAFANSLFSSCLIVVGDLGFGFGPFSSSSSF